MFDNTIIRFELLHYLNFNTHYRNNRPIVCTKQEQYKWHNTITYQKTNISEKDGSNRFIIYIYGKVSNYYGYAAKTSYKTQTAYVWYINGKMHRENLPAFMIIEDKYIIYTAWYRYDMLHRDDAAPDYTIISQFKRTEANGQWFYDFSLPAVIHYFKDELKNSRNSIKKEVYYKMGMKHRDNDLPSVIEYNRHGTPILYQYFIHNINKRINPRNPIEIAFSKTGRKLYFARRERNSYSICF